MWLPPDEYELWLLAWRRRLLVGGAFGLAGAVLMRALLHG
jgi:hypothetical protein